MIPLSLNFSWVPTDVQSHVVAVDVNMPRLFSLIKKECESCYFFESIALPRHQDRYHTIGFDPVATFTATGNALLIQGTEKALLSISNGASVIKTGNPYETLGENFPKHFASATHQGGLIGYFGHEAVNYFEQSLNLPEHESFPNFKVGLYLDGLLFDAETGILSYYHYGEENNRVDRVQQFLAKLPIHESPASLNNMEFLGNSKTKTAYIDAVKANKEKITQGFSFQSEVGFKSNFLISGDKFAIYNKLREVNPSPYMFYLKFNELELMGASPEILLSNRQGVLSTTPTAGTIRRGATEMEDKQLARMLLTDPKEISEHNMLVDLHRNDIGRVSKPGSVRVADLMFLIRFSHVQHIVSLITGELAESKTSFDALAAILPGGVTTGAPKIETIKIIHETERDPRGPYGGAVGRFSFNGDCEFCLAIRSLFCDGDRCFAQTSAGVVYDSVPEKEYDEVTRKLAAMMTTLESLKPPAKKPQ